jgi:hypothetical protein
MALSCADWYFGATAPFSITAWSTTCRWSDTGPTRAVTTRGLTAQSGRGKGDDETNLASECRITEEIHRTPGTTTLRVVDGLHVDLAEEVDLKCTAHRDGQPGTLTAAYQDNVTRPDGGGRFAHRGRHRRGRHPAWHISDSRLTTPEMSMIILVTSSQRLPLSGRADAS